MGDIVVKKRLNWVAPVVVALLAGICYYWLNGPFGEADPEGNAVLAAPAADAPPALDEAAPLTSPPPAAVRLANPVALEYVSAYREGRWDDLVRLTCWMQDRLGRVGSADSAAAVAALRARSGERVLEKNQLREEGVEDQYVFSPGAIVTPLGMDPGRDDLERPVLDRSWVRVTYPDRPSALRDEDGLPIRSLVVGINVSEDGLVLKANVVGNLDIDADSIQTFWSDTSKETGHGAG